MKEMNDNQKKVMKEDFSPGRFCLAIIVIVLRCYVLALYWSWFVVWSFPGLPPLTPLKIYGLTMFHRLFVLSRANLAVKDKRTPVQKWEHLWLQLILWMVALGTGWLIYIVVVYIGR